METVLTILLYFLAGILIIIFLLLVLALFLKALVEVIQFFWMIGCVCVSIPFLIFNPKDYRRGARLAKKYPYTWREKLEHARNDPKYAEDLLKELDM